MFVVMKEGLDDWNKIAKNIDNVLDAWEIGCRVLLEMPDPTLSLL